MVLDGLRPLNAPGAPSVASSDLSGPSPIPNPASSSESSIQPSSVSSSNSCLGQIVEGVKKFCLWVFSAMSRLIDTICGRRAENRPIPLSPLPERPQEALPGSLIVSAEPPAQIEETEGLSIPLVGQVTGVVKEQQTEFFPEVRQEIEKKLTAVSEIQKTIAELQNLREKTEGLQARIELMAPVDEPLEKNSSSDEDEDYNSLSDDEKSESIEELETRGQNPPDQPQQTQPPVVNSLEEQYNSLSDSDSEEDEDVQKIEKEGQAPSAQQQQTQSPVSVEPTKVEPPPPTPFAVFQALPFLSKEAKAAVAEFAQILSEKNLAELVLMKNELKKKSEALERIHPLRLFEHVLKNKTILDQIRSIPDKVGGAVLWNELVSEFSAPLLAYLQSEKEGLYEEFKMECEGFIDVAKLPCKDQLLAILYPTGADNSQDWDRFFRLLFSLPETPSSTSSWFSQTLGLFKSS